MLIRWILVCVAGLSLAVAPACGPRAGMPGDGPIRPIPQIARVLLVSVDGLRPDLALRADAP